MALQDVKKKISRIWDLYQIPVEQEVRRAVLEKMEQEWNVARPFPVQEDEEEWIREWAIKGWLWRYYEDWENQIVMGIKGFCLESKQTTNKFRDGTSRVEQGEEDYLLLLRSIAKLFGEQLTRYSNMFFGQLRDRTYIQGVTPDYFETTDEEPITRIRIFFPVRMRHSLADLIRNGTLSDEMARWLLKMNNIRANMIIFGGTGSGKTTLHNVLLEYIPHNELVVVVEAVREMFRTNPQTVYLETKPEVNASDLVKAALRMRTNRIVVDPVRSAEAYPLCQAWNTGHDGSMLTMYGQSVEGILDDLVWFSKGAGYGLPERALSDMVKEVLEVAVQMSRLQDGRWLVQGIYMWNKQTESWMPVWEWNGETWEKKNAVLVSSLQEKEQKWKKQEKRVYEPRKHHFVKTNVSVGESWLHFKTWLAQNIPSYVDKLNPPAPEEDIVWAEKEMGVTFPDDVKEFYRVHNGETEGMFGGREMLSLRYMVEGWRTWKELIDKGEFEGVYSRPETGIKRDWWNLKWIPLATNGGGDFYCLDLDPAEGGSVGQIIMMWHDEEERTVIASSFADWFAGMNRKLKSGMYTMDEGGCNNAFANME